MFGRIRWAAFALGFAVALALPAAAQYSECITGFESSEGFATSNEVIFQQPCFSGATIGVFCGDDGFGNPLEVAQVVDYTGFTGTQSYEIYFGWQDPGDAVGTSGVRNTTLAVAAFPRPSIHFRGKVRFKMAVTAFASLQDLIDINPITTGASILMAMTVTETGNNVGLGQPDTGGGDIEFVYLPGSEVIPTPGTNGFGTFPPGGKRFAATPTWPPTPGLIGQGGDFYDITFDFSDTNGITVLGYALGGAPIVTAGDGKLDATGTGDGVNRGNLEALVFSKDPTDTTGQYFAMYIDDVVFEAPDPDGTVPAPSIQQPVNEGTGINVTVLTRLNLCDNSDVDEAELFVNDISAGTAVPSGGEAVFVLDINSNDVLRATQTKDGVTSPLSLPVIAFAPGVAMADNFDAYLTQADMNAFWLNSISSPTPPSAFVHLSQGSAASCDNLIIEANPAGADAARLYRPIGALNGSVGSPLTVTWAFQHRGVNSGAGIRTRFELARFAGGFSASAAARLPGTTGIVLENGPGTVPLPQTLDEYNILLRSDDPATLGTNGFFAGNQGNVANTGILRENNKWHTMQIVVTDVLNYYIDGFLANPVDTNGVPLYPSGVPRPNQLDYTHIVIGQGFSNNGPEMLFDNISVTVGGTPPPFAAPNSVPSPTVVGPLFPGATQVTVADIDTNATSGPVALFIDGGEIMSTNGPFPTGSWTFTVAGLADGAAVAATQTVEVLGVPTESCLGTEVIVASPVVTLESPLVPGQTSVQVSNLEENVAEKVTVYVDLGEDVFVPIGSTGLPATDPVAVTVTSLVLGDTIVATQTIAGSASVPSAGVVVTVPAPTLPGSLFVGDNVVTVEGVHPLATKVVVLVDGNTSGVADVSTSSVTTVDITLGSTLVADEVVTATQTISGITSAESNAIIVVDVGTCVLAWSEDFEVNPTANWTVNGGPTDETADFFFDYVAATAPPNAGIPVAPSGGGTRGMKLQTNLTSAIFGGFSVSPTGQSFTGNFRVSFDLWANFNGPFPAGGSGSTNLSTFGILTSGTSVNYPGVADGVWFAATGDGGSSADWRAYSPAAVASYQDGDPVYAAATRNAPDPYYASFGNASAPAAQLALYAQQTGATQVGCIGMEWHQVDIIRSGNLVIWQVDGIPIATVNTTGMTLGGSNILFGHSDINATSSADPNDVNLLFTLIDNIRVYVPQQQPVTLGDWDGDGDKDLVDFASFADCLAGPGAAPAPPFAGCSGPCLDTFDFDVDDDVDLMDGAEFQKLIP